VADRHAEEYSRETGSLLFPPDDFDAVTPGASALASMAVNLYIGGAGDVEVVTKAGNTRVFKAVPVGTVLWGRFTHVLATNTTATYIVAGI
jgi:hypothetical protein